MAVKRLCQALRFAGVVVLAFGAWPALAAVTTENYDAQVGYVTPGAASGVTSFTLDGITYTTDQASEFAVDSYTVNQFGPPPLTSASAPNNGVLFGNVQGTSLTSLTMSLQNGDKMAVQSFDIDTFDGKVNVEALDTSGNVIGTVTLDPSSNGGSSTFHVDLSGNASFSGIRSLKFVEADIFYLSPTLDNFAYVDLSSPPSLTTTGGNTTFVANVGATPVVIDSGIVLSDGDAPTAKQGIVSIATNFHIGEDVLAFTNTSSALFGDISSSYSSSTGVLTLTSSSGTATIGQWQNAYRAVTYADAATVPNSGTRTVSFTLTSDAFNTASNTAQKSVVVTVPMTLTPTVLSDGEYQSPYSPVTFSAGGGTPPYTYSAIGLPPGMLINANSGVLSGTPTAAGTYSVSVTATDSSTGTGAPFTKTNLITLVIDKVPLTITANNESMVYGGSFPTFGVSYSGFVGGDNATSLTVQPFLGIAATPSSPVGSYAITPGGAVDPNYSISYAPGTLTITPAPLTITANSSSMIYGDPIPSLGASYSGFVNGDNASSLTTAPTLSTTATSASPVGIYPITASGAVDQNYVITYVPGTLTVGKRTLTVTADNKSMPLGGPLPALTASYSGFVNGDTVGSLTTIPTLSTTATAGSPSGTYPISVTGGSSPNYTFNDVPGTLTVAKQVLTITANPASSTYGSPLVPNGSLTVSYSGFINGDGPGSLTVPPVVINTAFVGAPAGSYSLIPSGAVDPNYTIVYVNGIYSISPASLNITANDASRVYGTANPAFSVSYSGFVNGDTATSLTAAPTVSTSAIANSPVGAYPITASGAVNPNYNITYTPGTLTITQAQQTVAFTSTIPTNPTAGGTYSVTATASSGLAATFTIDAASTAGACTVSNSVVAFTGAGSCIIDANQAGNANYGAAPQVQQTVTVGKATSTVTLQSSLNPAMYGQSVTFTATVSGQAPSGTVTFTLGTGTLCQAVALNGNAATCTTTALPVGSDIVAAAYSGDVNNTSSSSPTLTQTVNLKSTTVSLVAAPNPVVKGNPVTLTATVAGDPPTGSVSFTDNSTTLPCSPVTLVPGTTSSAAVCTATFTSTGLHSITATYSGDGNFAMASSPALILTVNPIAQPAVAAPALDRWAMLLLAGLIGGVGTLRRLRRAETRI